MNLKVLGYILRNLRHERGLTLRQLSKEVGIDHSFLSKIESGVAKIQRHQIVTLFHFYGVDRHHIEDDCSTFFPDLKDVLHANIENQPNKKTVRLCFLKKYNHLKNTKYLPYLHFVELEALSYSGQKNARFHYLLGVLTPDLLAQPYCFFLALRNLYSNGQGGNLEKVRLWIPRVNEQMEQVEEYYRPFGYYYLLSSYTFLGENLEVTQLYTKATQGLKAQGNRHFLMLTDIMYGGAMVMSREYRHAIKFYEELLTKSDYVITPLSKKSIMFNMAESYLHLNEIPQALDFYKKSYELKPQKSTAFFMAYCLYDQGDMAMAIKVIDQSVFIVSENRLYDALLKWLCKYMGKQNTRSYEIIRRLEEIEVKYKSQIDYCLKMVILKIKADFYHRLKNLEQENICLRQMIIALQSK